MDLLPFQYEDRLGVRHLFYVNEGRGLLDGLPTIDISIWPTPEVVIGSAPFQARFKQLSATTVWVDWVGNNGNEWAKRVGLTEAVFAHVALRYGVTVVSSRPFVEGGGEWRSVTAEAMWQRLSKDGLATYDSTADRYVFRPPLPLDVRDDNE